MPIFTQLKARSKGRLITGKEVGKLRDALCHVIVRMESSLVACLRRATSRVMMRSRDRRSFHAVLGAEQGSVAA